MWATATGKVPGGQWVGKGTDVGVPATGFPVTSSPLDRRQTRKAVSLKLANVGRALVGGDSGGTLEHVPA